MLTIHDINVLCKSLVEERDIEHIIIPKITNYRYIEVFKGKVKSVKDVK